MRFFLPLLLLFAACDESEETPAQDAGGLEDAASDSAAPDATAPDASPDVAVPEQEALCEDGEDEDLDGDTDCEDADCRHAVALEGACVNREDLRAIAFLDYNVEWNNCVVGENCFTDVECNTPCFARNTGLTEPCARCFAEIVVCIVGRCAGVCGGGGGSPECLACIGETCGPPYRECFGELVCDYEYACGDTIDNDGDGLTDRADPECDFQL